MPNQQYEVNQFHFFWLKQFTFNFLMNLPPFRLTPESRKRDVRMCEATCAMGFQLFDHDHDCSNFLFWLSSPYANASCCTYCTYDIIFVVVVLLMISRIMGLHRLFTGEFVHPRSYADYDARMPS